MTIEDAFEYLRSALHYLVKAGADIELDNKPDSVGITIGNSYWFSIKPGDIRFALIPVRGVPFDKGTPQEISSNTSTPESDAAMYSSPHPRTPQTG